jgi:hypothetical protein
VTEREMRCRRAADHHGKFSHIETGSSR